MRECNGCTYCGQQLPPRRRAHCGADDCRRKHRAKQQREFQRSWRERHGVNYRAQFTSTYPYTYTCDICGDTRRAKHETDRRCYPCRENEWARGAEQKRRARLPVPHPEASPASTLPAKHPARQPAPAEGRTWVQGACASCGDRYVIADQLTSRYCSVRCARREARRKRRNLELDAEAKSYNRKQIFERDSWKCQLCGRRARRDAPHGHPLSATIDHIVPLSVGGEDSPSNVQCAHLRCNSRKSNRFGGQLRLDIV